jgi:putative ABC transport system permease protein
MRITLAILSLITLAARRIWNHRLLMLCLLLGLVVAVGLLSSVPLYADAARNKLLQGELTEAGTHRPPFAFLWRYVGTWHGNIKWEDYEPVNAYLAEQAPGIMGLPVEFQTHHVASDKLRLFPTEDAAFIPDEPLMWASVGFVTDLYEHIQLLEGSFPVENQPREAVEILISRKIADTLGLQVGEHYTLFAMGQDGAQIPVHVAGVWQPIDLADPFWFYQPDAFDEIFLTSESAFTQQVVPAAETPVASAVWYQVYDGSLVRPAHVNGLLEKVSTVEARVAVLLDNTTLDISPVPALQGYGESSGVLTLTLSIFSLPVIGLVFYFISLIAGMVVRRGQSEIAIMRSRGITRRQISGIYALQGLLVGGVGLAGGLTLGRWMAQLMSRARTFLDPVMLSGNSESLAIVFTPTAYAYALTGVALTLVALLIPVLNAARHSIVTLRWEQARSLLSPFWQRYFLDVLLLVLPLYGWYQLNKQGAIGLGAARQDPFANPLLFLTPVLFCFSLGLFLIRLFPLLMHALAWLASWLEGTTLLLTLRQLARAAAQYMGPLLLLSLTVSLATFSASMAVTLDDHLWDQVYYQIGADLNLAELGESTQEEEQLTLPGQTSAPQEESEDEPQWLFLPVGEHLNVPGVQAAVRVGDYDATANIGGRQHAGRILGIDWSDLPQVAFFRPDFAYNASFGNGESLGGLMNRLAVARDSILVSSNFMAWQGLVVGDPLVLNVGAAGEFADISFTIVGALDLFPTLYPQDGPFFVANLDHLHNGLGGTYPYDVWLATDAAVPSASIVEGVRDLGLVVVTSPDARETILAEQTRPERQGLFGLLSVGFVASAMLTVIGFLVYAVVSFQRRFIELGMLRAIGLSVGQMTAFLTGELAALILAGVALGTGLGVWASSIFIPYFQVGGDKTAFVPPFIVQIAWERLGTIFALYGAMFIFAVLLLAALLIRMRVFEAVKLGETV